MKEKASQFWNWFASHSAAYLFLKDVDNTVKSRLLQDLKQHLHAYCNKLCFEIGGDPESDQELIITADGNTEYFRYAETLIAEAPELEGWDFIALIPPRGAEFEISINGLVLRARDMWFQPMGHPNFPELMGIRVCIPNYETYKDSEWMHQAICKMVEYIIGEKSFALNMHYIDIGELPEAPVEWGMFPLQNLEKFIQWRQSRALEVIRNN